MSKKNVIFVMKSSLGYQRRTGNKNRGLLIYYENLHYLGEIGWDEVDWIDMALERDQWRALVNTVLNLRVP
jgi:hypothetical protein